MTRLILIGMLLFTVGCSYTGEATQVWVYDSSGEFCLGGQSAETLGNLLDDVGYDRKRHEGGTGSLVNGRLLERLHYLATFPARLVMLTNEAERRLMSPDPVHEQQIGKPHHLAPDAAREEVVRLLDSPSAARRLYGLALLGEKGIGPHGGRAQQLLSDRNISVRSEAARLMGQYRFAPAVGALQKMAVEDSDEFNRIGAMLSLEKIGGRRSLPFLHRLARKASSAFVRAKACGILGRYREARTIGTLVTCLQRDDEWLVRDEAAGSLSKITRIAIPRSAYREPKNLGELLLQLRAWCHARRIDVLF